MSHKSSPDYAGRTPAIPGDWFEYYWTGQGFLRTAPTPRHEYIQRFSEIGLLAYGTDYELKGRPKFGYETTERINNDRGYLSYNTKQADPFTQNANRGSNSFRRKHKELVQQSYTPSKYTRPVPLQRSITYPLPTHQFRGGSTIFTHHHRTPPHKRKSRSSTRESQFPKYARSTD